MVANEAANINGLLGAIAKIVHRSLCLETYDNYQKKPPRRAAF